MSRTVESLGPEGDETVAPPFAAVRAEVLEKMVGSVVKTVVAEITDALDVKEDDTRSLSVP